MPIPIIGEIVPVTSGAFPIASVGNIRGAYYSVPTTTARDAIALNNIATGMLIHVQASNLSYRWSGSWVEEVVVGSGMGTTFTFTPTGSLLVTHNLGYRPNITLIDTDNNLLFGGITYNSLNSFTLSFNHSAAGTGYLS